MTTPTTAEVSRSESTVVKIDGFRGRLIGPDHADYDAARGVWNGAIDRHPRLIARCIGTADVIADDITFDDGFLKSPPNVGESAAHHPDDLQVASRPVHGFGASDIEQVQYRPSADRALDLEVFSMSDLRRRVHRAHLQRHHRYDFHMFVHVRRGKCRAVVDFTHIECGAGSLLTIRPGQVHRFGPGSRWDANLLLFRPELLQASQGEERLQMPELVDALPAHLRLDGSTRRFVADTLARMEQECALDARRPLLNWLLQSELATLVTRLHIFHAEQRRSHATPQQAVVGPI